MKPLLKTTFFLAVIAISAASMAQTGGGGGAGRGQRGGFGGGQAQSDYMLLNRADVQMDLALNADQKASLDKIRQESGMGGRGGRGGAGGAGGAGGRRGGGAGGAGGVGGGAAGGAGGAGGGAAMTPEQMAERRKQQEERVKAFEEKAKAVLSDTQNSRLKQIAVQLAGPRALLRKDVQESLGLSAETVAKATQLRDDAQKANGEVQVKIRNQEMERADGQAIIEKNNKALGDELLKLLTADQASKLKEMGGAEFKAEAPQGRGGGGGGI